MSKQDQQKPVRYSLKMFVAQFANSALSNTLGGAVGHPLDTIRVSSPVIFTCV